MTHFERHWLFVNMPFTKKDKILIKNVFELKGYNAKHLVRASRQRLVRQQCLQVGAIATAYWVGRPSLRLWQMTQRPH